MKASNSTVAEIIQVCLEMDAIAHQIFAKFAKQSPDKELGEDFSEMAKDEKSHLRFWKKALEMSQKNELAYMPENAPILLDKLLVIKGKISSSQKNTFGNKVPDIGEMLEIAYQIESLMLDKDMINMFDIFRIVEPNIESEYNEHISRMIQILRKHGGKASGSHFDMLGDALSNLWETTKKALREGISDPLTGILNRRGFFKLVLPLATIAQRRKIPAGIIMCDIDNFKKINDTHGHPAGDMAIKTVAKIITRYTRKSDICARYGGEEFVIFMLSENTSAFYFTAERIRKKIASESEPSCGINFTASFGVISKLLEFGDKNEINALISEADENLLKAKQEGKNKTCGVNIH